MNFTMSCIRCHSRFFHLLPTHLKHKHSSKTNQLLWGSNSEPTLPHHHQLLRRIQNLPSLPLMRHPPQSLPTSTLVFGLTSPPAESGDISVFLQTSAVLLAAYWISNFVVPDLINKSLQTKNQSEEQMPKDEKPTRR